MPKPFLVPRILGDDEDFPINPNDIDVRYDKDLVGAFDVPVRPNDHPDTTRYWNEKMNEGATIIVLACQKQGHWGPFDPFRYCKGHEEATMSLYTFLEKNHQFSELVVAALDGLYRVTDAFVIYCYLAAPKIRKRQSVLPSTTAKIEG